MLPLTRGDGAMAEQEGSGTTLRWFFGGALAGIGFAAWARAERKKSRAERQFPSETIELAEDVMDTLSDLTYKGVRGSEAIYQEALADLLEEELSCPIEENPRTPFGEPDILLDGLVALELKCSPRKSETDRCVGQVASFAKEWLTIVVLIDTSPSRVQAVRDALDAAELDDVAIVALET